MVKKCSCSEKLNSCVKSVIILALILALSSIYLLIFSIKRERLTPPKDNNDKIVSSKEDEKAVYTCLVLGEDQSVGLTDVVILASYNTKNGELNILQIPRDTYAAYTTNAYRKINGAKFVLDGSKGVLDFISQNLQVDIDFYVSVSLEALEKIVDFLGGVEVNVPFDMNYQDPYQNLYINISKGKQILDGENAVKFLRYRSGYIRGDLSRVDAQKLFLSGLLKGIKDNYSASNLIKMGIKILPYVDSNIDKEALQIFSKATLNFDFSKVSLMTLPGGDIRGSSGASYYVMNKRETMKVLNKYFCVSFDTDNFDAERKFTSEARAGFDEIYDAKTGFETKVYSADEIYSDGIDIK